MFRSMVAFTSAISLRLQIASLRDIRADDQHPAIGTIELSRDFMERVLPQIQQLHGHVAQMLHLWAGTARLWELKRAKQLSNDAVEQTSKRQSRRRKKAGNGKPANGLNRIEALLNGQNGRGGNGHG